MSTSESVLNTVEAELKQYEEYLSRDLDPQYATKFKRRNTAGTSSASNAAHDSEPAAIVATTSSSGNPSSTATGLSSEWMQPSPASRNVEPSASNVQHNQASPSRDKKRLSDEQRQELLARLQREREDRLSGSMLNHGNAAANKSLDTSSASAAGHGSKTDRSGRNRERREQILAQLMKEKAARNASQSQLNDSDHGVRRYEEEVFEYEAIDKVDDGQDRDDDGLLEYAIEAEKASMTLSPASQSHDASRSGGKQPRGRKTSSPGRNVEEDVEASTMDDWVLTHGHAQYRSSGSSSRTPGGHRRPQSAPRNRYAKDVIQQQIEAEIAQQCTFKPKINTEAAAHLQRPAAIEDRISALAKARELELARREKEKAKREQQELAECTFKPRINKETAITSTNNSSHNVSKYALREHIPADERLYHDADDRILERERRRRQQEEAALQECGFAPRLAAAARTERILEASEYRPVHERIGELQKNKQQRLAKMRQGGDPHAEHSFTPSINATSQRLAADRAAEDVAERLHRDGQHRTMRVSADRDELHRAFEQECTFRPQIDSNSVRILQQSERFAGSNRDFVQRQAAWARQQQRRLEMDAAMLEQQKREMLEQSRIQSKQQRANNPEDDSETPDERLERLAVRDAARAEALRKRAQEQYYAQFSFKPTIDARSERLARASSVDELVKNEHNRKVREAAQRAAEEALAKECTFKPQRVSSASSQNNTSATQNTSSHNISSISALSSPNKSTFADVATISKNMEAYRKERERRLEEARKAAEYDELKECTFRPEVRKSTVKQPEGPILVRGLGRYLERQEAARKKDEEQREREEKAFMVHVHTGAGAAGASGHPFTIPQPFQLHSEYHSEVRKHRLQEELRRKEMEECTFQPKTNESESRQLLQRILQDDEAGSR